MFFILVAFCLLCIQGTGAKNCPSKSVEFQGYCYFFQVVLSEFPDAELTCLAMSGHLASIHDGFTNALLTSGSTLSLMSLLMEFSLA